MAKKRMNNYRLFLFSNSLTALAVGLFTPFYIIFIQGFGNSLEQFGFAIGLMTLAGAITSYFAGKYSDKIGRKPFLIFGGFVLTLLIIAYTWINNLYQLYLLQIINGIISSMLATMETSFLADLTKKSSRGIDIGKYMAITGVIASFAVMIRGVVAASLGYKIVFYIVAAFIFISTIILFYIKEK